MDQHVGGAPVAHAAGPAPPFPQRRRDPDAPATRGALPHLTSASVLAMGMAYWCFKRVGKDRPDPAESPHTPLRGIECETIEKADFT